MGKIKSKWDSLDKGVQKWATRLGAITTIIGALVAGGRWLIHQVDDAVATRIEGQTVQIQQEVQKLTEKVDVHKEKSEMQIMRLELLALVESDPTNVIEIKKLYHEYREKGGNSYIASVMQKWCDKYYTTCDL